MYIDTHSHVYLPEFDEDRDDMLIRALNKGVQRILLPNIDSSTIKSLKSCVAINDKVFKGMMGLHPGSVKLNYTDELAKIKTELYAGNYIAVGEIGIDLYWDKTFIEEQKMAFKTQIEWALELNLPIVIHARESLSEIFSILKAYKKTPLKGVFHCFSGNEAELKEALSFENFMLGIGGVVTFKNGGLDKIISNAPIERLVLETDAPYLSPAPYRGKRNEPAYIPLIAAKLSEVLNAELDSIENVSTQNAEQLFNLVADE